MARLKVLYFIQTSKPTNNDKQVAFYTGQSVAFRKFALVKDTDVAEPCDAVMGAIIPKLYANKPTLDSVMAAKSDATPISAFNKAEQAAIATEVAKEVAATKAV